MFQRSVFLAGDEVIETDAFVVEPLAVTPMPKELEDEPVDVLRLWFVVTDRLDSSELSALANIG